MQIKAIEMGCHVEHESVAKFCCRANKIEREREFIDDSRGCFANNGVALFTFQSIILE